jgi:hypothetical protein
MHLGGQKTHAHACEEARRLTHMHGNHISTHERHKVECVRV